jgi:uncharacterized protein
MENFLMKSRISKLIEDFHKREWPAPFPMDQKIPRINGNAEAIVGMRSPGRISCCYQKMSELINEGLRKEEILYLNFSDHRLFEFETKNLQEIIDVYYSKYPHCKNSQCHFFFDNIQQVEHWELFIRRLLNTENVKVYLTGTSSIMLGRHFGVDRDRHNKPIEVFPFSFKEFLKFHQLFNKEPKIFNTQTRTILRNAIADYLEIGGFREVQSMDSHTRIKTLQGYIDTVILKDIIERYNVSNLKVLKLLVRSIMNSIGKKFSINNFYNTMKRMSIKCTKNSLYDYLDYMAEAYVFFKVPLHSPSKKARQINPVKIYTIDTGVINAMTFRLSNDYASLLENMVYMHLRRRGDTIKYIKTTNDREISFLTTQKESGEKELIQVCWDLNNIKTLKREIKNMQRTLQQYESLTGTIVTWDEEFELFDEIRILPVWKWLLT